MGDTIHTEKFNIQSLPTEVLVEIFGYLDTEDLFTCNKVSQRIRSVVKESKWKRFNLNFNQEIPVKFIEQILNEGCEYLSLQHARLCGMINLDKVSKLKFLDLSNCRSTVTYDGQKSFKFGTSNYDLIRRSRVKLFILKFLTQIKILFSYRDWF